MGVRAAGQALVCGGFFGWFHLGAAYVTCNGTAAAMWARLGKLAPVVTVCRAGAGGALFRDVPPVREFGMVEFAWFEVDALGLASRRACF